MVVDLEKKHYAYPSMVIGISIIIVLAIIFLAIRPIYRGNIKVVKETKVKRDELNALEDRLSSLKDLKDREADLTEEKNRVLVALPEGKDVPKLFVQLEKIISDTGASVESVEEGDLSTSTTSVASAKGENIKDVTNYKYKVAFTTPTYESFKNVLLNSEKALRLIDISAIDISYKDNSFAIKLSLDTYSRNNIGGNKQ